MRHKILQWLKQDNVTSIMLYAVSLLMMKGASLFMLPLMTSYLTPSQFGHLELLSITTVFFSLLVGLAMHENLYRFIGTEKNEALRFSRARELYSSSLFTSFVIVGLLAAGYLAISPTAWTINTEQMVLLAVVITVEAPLAICLAWLRLNNKAVTFFKISCVTLLIQVSLVILILTSKPDVTLLFSVGVLCALIQITYLHCHNKFSFKLPTLIQYKGYIQYSLPLMLSAAVAFGLSGAERWIIAEAHSLESLGIYAVAAKFSLALGILIQPFHMWWMPKRFEVLETHGKETAAKNTQLGIIGLCMLSVIVMWVSQCFIVLTLPTGYQSAGQLVVLCIVIMLLKEMVEMLNIGVLYAKQTSKLFAINAAATTVALIIAWLNREAGVAAILLSLCMGQLIRLVLIYRLSQSLCHVPYRHGALLSFVLISAVFTISGWFNHSLETAGLMLVLQPLALIALLHKLKFIALTANVAQKVRRHNQLERPL
ncbi:membrane protein [Vibrio neptunius]|uniref:lipopolysaccharide biosynthesis protein n=1 Tax=Vibrio neptunius TaxID=170651 RepID=UPI0005FA22BF|nr:membrane protein [Vibrio neptunius]KJY94227.1 membrane protein [Vibrio neptunius]